jgi:guanine deaminase
MTTILFRDCLVMRDARSEFNPAPQDVLIDGDRIAAIQPSGTISGADEIVDAKGMLAAAGMINGHFHSWDHYIKGRVENLPMELMMPYLRPSKPLQLTDRQVYLRTMAGAIESLRTGTTTIVDDMSLGSSLNRGHAEAALQAYEDSGLRAFLGFSMIDRAVVDSWPFAEQCFAPDLLAELRALPRPKGDDLLDLVRDLADTHHPGSHRVGVLVAPSAPQRCSDKFLRKCRALADELDLPTIIHLLETRLQVITADEFYGKSMVEYLNDLGFLAPKTSLIHAVWLTPRDRELIAASGATIQYNPFSNAVLGAGVADFRAFQEASINVSMGSDGCGIPFTCSMSTTIKFGACLPRIRNAAHDKWPTSADIWEAATTGGAIAFGREKDLGRLEPGYKADFVLYRLDCSGLLPLNVPVRQLVHGEVVAGIDIVVVDGQVVVQDGKLTLIDEATIIAELQAVHAELKDQIMGSEEAARPVLEGVSKAYHMALKRTVPANMTRALLDDNAQNAEKP